MMQKQYGERMRKEIVDLLKRHPNEQFSTSDIGICLNMPYLSARRYLQTMKKKNPYRNFKWELADKHVVVYWWVEK